MNIIQKATLSSQSLLQWTKYHVITLANYITALAKTKSPTKKSKRTIKSVDTNTRTFILSVGPPTYRQYQLLTSEERHEIKHTAFTTAHFKQPKKKSTTHSKNWGILSDSARRKLRVTRHKNITRRRKQLWNAIGLIDKSELKTLKKALHAATKQQDGVRAHPPCCYLIMTKGIVLIGVKMWST